MSIWSVTVFRGSKDRNVRNGFQKILLPLMSGTTCNNMCFQKWSRSKNYHTTATLNTQETKRSFIYDDEILVYNYQKGGMPSKVHSIWLRHHCQCELCFNKKTNQRNQIPSDLPSVSTILKSKYDKDKLLVSFIDGHESQFPISWLQKYAPKPANQMQSYSLQFQYKFEDRLSKCLENIKEEMVFPNFKNLHTNTNLIESAITFTEFMKDDDEGVHHLLSNILKNGYGIVKGCPADFETTKKVISKVSHPQNTIFGDFSEWTSDLAHADTAYTADFVHLHTDTSYFTEPAGLQIFHCLKHEGTGGVNFLADGFHIALQVAKNNLEYYKLLSSIHVPSQYIDAGKHYFCSNDVIFGHDWVSGKISKIRYNPHDMAPLVTLSFENVAKFYESLVYFCNLLENNPYKIKLTPGTVIFLDNWRVLHGRDAYTGFRHLCGAYISRSDWLSRARTLGLLGD